MGLVEKLPLIQNQQDLSLFIKELRENLDQEPNEWENQHLGQYLDAMAAWLSDAKTYFASEFPNSNEATWRIIGTLLLAAKVYE